MSNTTDTDELRARPLQGIAEAARAHPNGHANAHTVGEQLGLSHEQTDELRAKLHEEHLIERAQTSAVVRVTPLGHQRLQQG